jgi:hypothetical protein
VSQSHNQAPCKGFLVVLAVFVFFRGMRGRKAKEVSLSGKCNLLVGCDICCFLGFGMGVSIDYNKRREFIYT